MNNDLLKTTDAKIWAQEWMKTLKEHPEIATDENTMTTWFANAISVGYDSCYSKYTFAFTEDTYEATKKAYVKAISNIEDKTLDNLNYE